MGFMVDYAALGDVAAQLKGIKGDFDEAEDRFKAQREATGDGHVNDALHRFATKWSDKRGEIGERMDEVAGYAGTASETYGTTDRDFERGINEIL